jgi:CBS domain containing-hemolysin-like protein
MARPLVRRSVAALMADQRMLLITLMLGNMTVNALYFVISSVLTMRAHAGIALGMLLALGFLVAIVLVGEVMPKMLANAQPVPFTQATAPLLRALHASIVPLRVAVDRLVVTPLSRLTAPAAAPPRLDEEELRALLELSGRQGVIDAEEHRVIREVFAFSRLKARDVMTPRVRMHAVPREVTPGEVRQIVRESRLTRLPVYEGDLDHIVGLLHVKRFLMGAGDESPPAPDLISRPMFVPEMATLDQLLELLRGARAQSAIVVDEFGGTAGIVAIRDLVEELVGEIVGEDEIHSQPPESIGPNRWRVAGETSIHEWAEAFGQRLASPSVSTLGGLITARLGRAPQSGDRVELGNVRLEVESAHGARVVSAIVTLTEELPPAEESTA